MKPRSIHRVALFPLLAAALLSACSDQLPSDPSAAPVSPRMTVTPTNALATLDAGLTHTCGLTSAGQSWCWGRNAGGQLGDSSAAATTVPVATFQLGGPTFGGVITAGNSHTCALDTSAAAWCWGYNGDGRLADGSFNLRMAPSAVTGGLSFTAISAGGQHSCALDSSGQGYCWGSNAYGQVGDSTTAFAYGPTLVKQPAGVTFVSIQAADKHTCALASTGQAYCWGFGGEGAVGHGSLIGSRIPVAVSQPVGVTFTEVVTEYNHSCGLTSGGQAYCWGLNSSSQLGDSTTTNRTSPVAVQQPGGLTFAQLSTGSAFTCGLDGGGPAWCWGNNGNGQLGIGSLTASRVPAAVSQPSGVTFTEVRAGGVHGCGLDTVGQAWCWGRNNYNQMGDGTSTQRTSPVAVSH
jgi:alpha-tubulin suppressor-like RCC1 family protein